MVPPDEIKDAAGLPRQSAPACGGDRNLKPRTTPAPAVPLATRSAASSLRARSAVLFVCIGNSCRSQMAEAFARAYGAEMMVAESAGLSPATIIAPLTKQVLAERNLNIDGHFPKGLEIACARAFRRGGEHERAAGEHAQRARGDLAGARSHRAVARACTAAWCSRSKGW